VPTTLRLFREKHPVLASATQLFLFPGRVDQQTESVSGREAEEFSFQLSRCFSYALLRPYSFDIRTGIAYFHLAEEVRLQYACATRYASEKYLFLDATKFRKEGEAGYSVAEMLKTLIPSRSTRCRRSMMIG
jgi:DeoR/GlpR family transcriptional regulator of sugar metabolism